MYFNGAQLQHLPPPNPFLSTPFEQPSAATPSGQAQACKPRHHRPYYHADQRWACMHVRSVCVVGRDGKVGKEQNVNSVLNHAGQGQIILKSGLRGVRRWKECE